MEYYFKCSDMWEIIVFQEINIGKDFSIPRPKTNDREPYE